MDTNKKFFKIGIVGLLIGTTITVLFGLFLNNFNPVLWWPAINSVWIVFIAIGFRDQFANTEDRQ